MWESKRVALPCPCPCPSFPSSPLSALPKLVGRGDAFFLSTTTALSPLLSLRSSTSALHPRAQSPQHIHNIRIHLQSSSESLPFFLVSGYNSNTRDQSHSPTAHRDPPTAAQHIASQARRQCFALPCTALNALITGDSDRHSQSAGASLYNCLNLAAILDSLADWK